MGITLANFQLKAIEALMEAMGEPNRDIILKSCTGSGKTIILTHFMDEYLKSTNKAVFVWLTPGKGNLELQSKAKMDKYIHGSNTKLLSDIMSSGFEENDACFINWEKLTKKGNNALKDSERTNFVEHKHKDAKDDSAYSTDQIIIAFSQLLEYIMTKGLPERKKDITSSEKVVWLDSYEDLKNGNYDVIFKSAKYNHVRNEIDTETMQERGRRKRPQDGDEEKTHLCIRLAKGENRFLAVHESNHYGITLKCIIDYLNEQFKKFNEDGNDPYHYTIESQIMPGEDFLSSIKRAKTMSVLKLTVYKDDIKDGFMRFAGRTDIADEVDICLKRPKGYKCFPENLIKEYFKDSQDKAKGKIKRIKIIGTNDAGSFEVDTNITGMKHFLKVKGESVTNEVESSDFFVKAQEFIASMGGRI